MVFSCLLSFHRTSCIFHSRHRKVWLTPSHSGRQERQLGKFPLFQAYTWESLIQATVLVLYDNFPRYLHMDQGFLCHGLEIVQHLLLPERVVDLFFLVTPLYINATFSTWIPNGTFTIKWTKLYNFLLKYSQLWFCKHIPQFSWVQLEPCTLFASKHWPKIVMAISWEMPLMTEPIFTINWYLTPP